MGTVSHVVRRLSTIGALAILFGCSSDEPSGESPNPSGGGGAPGSSGATASNGGGSSGGASNGGASGAGASNGGASNGGASAGGSSTGGRPSNGGATSSGGLNAGGASNGGSPATGGASPGDGGACFRATLLWSEDFETGDYSRWTSNSYGNSWGNDCQSNGLSTEQHVSSTHSNKSVITCAYTAMGNVHRGYGGVQFSGDTPLPAYTNTGVGIDAPFGVVNTYWSYLQTNTVFQNGTWFSFWTVTDACDWTGSDVMTLGLEDPSNQLAAAHYQVNGGTRTYINGPLAFPLGRWVRTTIYINYYDDVMHVWQDGVEQSHVTFTRTRNTICHFHWGAYASGDNDNIVLYEDDNSIWKLGEAWTDLGVEPYLGRSIAVCP